LLRLGFEEDFIEFLYTVAGFFAPMMKRNRQLCISADRSARGRTSSLHPLRHRRRKLCRTPQVTREAAVLKNSRDEKSGSRLPFYLSACQIKNLTKKLPDFTRSKIIMI